MNKISPEIIGRIVEDSKKAYSKKGQHAELMKRSERFLKELQGQIEIRKLFDRFNNDVIFCSYLKPGVSVGQGAFLWNIFCHKWKIKIGWNGDLRNLESEIRDTPIIYFDHAAAGVPEKLEDGPDSLDPALVFEPVLLKQFIHLKIEEWTTLEDIKKIWPEIEKFQRKIFSHKSEKKAASFGRDLAWYDLKMIHHLSFGQIAKLWVAQCPGDIDSIVIKSFNKKNISALKEALRGSLSIMRDYDLMLKKIKSGEMGCDLRLAFEQEWKLYALGETERGKRFTPRFIDAIKQGIGRIKRYIEMIELATEFGLTNS